MRDAPDAPSAQEKGKKWEARNRECGGLTPLLIRPGLVGLRNLVFNDVGARTTRLFSLTLKPIGSGVQ